MSRTCKQESRKELAILNFLSQDHRQRASVEASSAAASQELLSQKCLEPHWFLAAALHRSNFVIVIVIVVSGSGLSQQKNHATARYVHAGIAHSSSLS